MCIRDSHNEKGLPEVDAAGLRVLPGFLDLHTHGAAGVDVNAADAEGLRTIGRFFASRGVTGWLGSVLTDTPEQTLWCMEQARQVIEGGPCGGAALLGVHLEGPCLSSEYKGAMPEHLLMHTADAELFAKYQKASGGHVRYTTPVSYKHLDVYKRQQLGMGAHFTGRCYCNLAVRRLYVATGVRYTESCGGCLYQ